MYNAKCTVHYACRITILLVLGTVAVVEVAHPASSSPSTVPRSCAQLAAAMGPWVGRLGTPTVSRHVSPLPLAGQGRAILAAGQGLAILPASSMLF